MEQDHEHQSHPHFPVDLDAPAVNQKNSLVDYILFGLIAISTLITVSFSIYIVAAKYF